MSIREHGGAVRYWRNKVNGVRACLCQDGVVLLLQHGKWTFVADYIAGLNVPEDERGADYAADAANWEPDSRPALTAAITRTNREARRRGES